MNTQKLPILVLGLAATSLSGQTLVSYNFGTDITNSTQFSSAFVSQGGSFVDGFTYSSSAGVGGIAGRINAKTPGSADHTEHVFSSSSYGWTANTTYEVSTYFLTGTVGNNIAQVMNGFVRSSGSSLVSGAGSGVTGQLRQNDASTVFLRLYQMNTQVGSNSASFTLSNNTWYQLVTQVNLANATLANSLSVSLYSRGTDGTATASLVGSVSATAVTIGNNGFNTSNFWTGFGGGNNSGSNIVAFDNFSAAVAPIPEPSSFAALAGLGALGLVGMRRRRRA